MSIIPQYGGKVFLEIGTWVMVDNPLQHHTLNPTHSRIAHYCRDEGYGPHVWTSLENLACHDCGELMPEDIQTAFTLHNFDVMRTGKKVRFSARHGLEVRFKGLE